MTHWLVTFVLCSHVWTSWKEVLSQSYFFFQEKKIGNGNCDSLVVMVVVMSPCLFSQAMFLCPQVRWLWDILFYVSMSVNILQPRLKLLNYKRNGVFYLVCGFNLNTKVDLVTLTCDLKWLQGGHSVRHRIFIYWKIYLIPIPAGDCSHLDQCFPLIYKLMTVTFIPVSVNCHKHMNIDICPIYSYFDVEDLVKSCRYQRNVKWHINL